MKSRTATRFEVLQKMGKCSFRRCGSQPFWVDFFRIFCITPQRIGSFEQKVKKLDGRDGYIDWLWKGNLLIEHKSRGKNLERAYQQTIDYFPGLKEHELPRFVLVSDFARFRLFDLVNDVQTEFLLQDLHKNVQLFWFFAGYQSQKISPENPINAKAVQHMARMHDQLKQIGYAGHELEVYLVRLLFRMLPKTPAFIERTQFTEFIERNTREDGSDLVFILPNATLYHFGILTSTMHNAWMRTVCGRLKSDYRYSAGIVYNNFPCRKFPTNSKKLLKPLRKACWTRAPSFPIQRWPICMIR